MGRDALDKIKEKIPESQLTGFLQVQGKSVTRTREKIAKILENGLCAYSPSELMELTGLPRMSIYRNLKILQQKRLIHYAPSLDVYFCCQKLFKSKGRLASTCHSFGICQTCKHVEEFIHTKHAHPRLRRIGNLKTDHEWLGLCSNCDRP